MLLQCREGDDNGSHFQWDIIVSMEIDATKMFVNCILLYYMVFFFPPREKINPPPLNRAIWAFGMRISGLNMIYILHIYIYINV